MRTLKLQVQVTVDGFVAGPDGQLDWLTPPDEKLLDFINRLTDASDTILLGRRTAGGFMAYRESVLTRRDSPEYGFARRMVDTPKVVFSKRVTEMAGQNVRVENGELVKAVKQIKERAGRDIIAYGGAAFVGALIEYALVDELHLFVNPVALGRGLRVFSNRTSLHLSASTAYSNGLVVNTYTRT